MKFISWNVNGLRACLGKGFTESMKVLDPDFICLQEIKMEKGQAEHGLDGYSEVWNSAVKRGYSGTAVFARTEPLSRAMGMGVPDHDNEGRLITLEYPEFYLVCAYTPNSQRELARLDYRMRWEDDFRAYLKGLDAVKPVILCGDLNVAHQEIDIKNPRSNRRNAGFTDEERDKMTVLLASGFTDAFRSLHPETRDAYTWWSYMAKARERNIGWRIDYFLVSNRLMPNVKSASIYPDIWGSDHCPVGLELEP
ncbi:MAG: exodeoxyribonuclease III [Defluviitaleaceae bacterium]|nr:exodeoxyribonuclease III [Defluviitaleaceae bacterium]MCL2836580.1 exodeoxyribonuclease III [Defluviitaleaceae bacterium]